MKTLIKFIIWFLVVPYFFYRLGINAQVNYSLENPPTCTELHFNVQPVNEEQTEPNNAIENITHKGHIEIKAECNEESNSKIEQAEPQELQEVVEFTGKVSFYTNEYCEKFNPSCLTASGVRFDDTKLTSACDSNFPLGTKFVVTYQNKSVEVTCNDRGSFSEKYGRVMDLSKEAFSQLAPLSKGILAVNIKEIK